MTSSAKRVAVIGSGPYGLMSMSVLKERGFDVVGFEKHGDIGGQWNLKILTDPRGYSDLEKDGSVSPMYQELVFNTSKTHDEFPGFRKYDVDAQTEFFTWDVYMKYLESFEKEKNLKPLIKFNTYVSETEKLANGRWRVRYNTEGKNKFEDFDYVAVATGYYSFPRYPEIKGSRSGVFKGLEIHAAQLRSGSPLFSGKNVLLVGGSFSGSECAWIALTAGAKKVHWAVSRDNQGSRRHWFCRRYSTLPNGNKIPVDLMACRYTHIYKPAAYGEYVKSIVQLNKHCLDTPDEPEMKFPGDYLVIGELDMFDDEVAKGRLAYTPPISEVKEGGVAFRDGSSLDDVDIIIYCTGYQPRYPFLDRIWSKEDQDKGAFYLYTLAVQKELHGMAFIAPYVVLEPPQRVIYMTLHWLANMWTGRSYDKDGNLYNAKEMAEMESWIAERYKGWPAFMNFNDHRPMNLLCDEVAAKVGCEPPDCIELIKGHTSRADTELGVALLFGAYHWSQFFLRGPFSRPEEARARVVEQARMNLKYQSKNLDEMVDKAWADPGYILDMIK